ncbi:MAG: hypothetical protein RBS16_02580 [Candidatus Cloacimonadales bacterium]|jgi:hypothetical protein|nr:hypothetical protein [Candidatus Cloacimonadota bacterium]MDD2650116.1 hypothetical protein [Candidatus Cloacimonadota bacterium]MDD3500905.1 hypothetical protein [Candidatus Cloacimonadota bacterium]MDX9976897.1 hypothetical protein [Candidatus Cloacimonadales bacterium]
MRYIITLVTVFLLHFFVINFNQHSITKNIRKTKELNTELAVAKNCNSELISIRNQLCLKERICNYATDKLGMVDSVSNNSEQKGDIILVYEQQKKDTVLFSLLDFFTPDAQALNSYRE